MPKVFISHSSVDKQIATTIAQSLQNAGVDVWFDEWALNPGDSLVAKIETGVADSNTVVFMISESSINSQWVRGEINAFLNADFSRRDIRIIPVRLDNSEIPLLLRDRLYIDLRGHDKSRAINQLVTLVSQSKDVCVTLPAAVEIENFNSGILGFNRLGGTTIVFHENGNPNSFKASFAKRDNGRALFLNYDFSTNSSQGIPPQFVGYATRLQYADWTDFLNCDYSLAFDIRSDGNTPDVRLEIKRLVTPPDENTRQIVAQWAINVTAQWTRTRIRLKDMALPGLD